MMQGKDLIDYWLRCAEHYLWTQPPSCMILVQGGYMNHAGVKMPTYHFEHCPLKPNE